MASTRRTGRSRIVQLGERFAMAFQPHVAIEDHAALPFDVELTLAPVDGRIVIDKVLLSRRDDGPEVTSALLRELPLQSLIHHAVTGGFLNGLMRRSGDRAYVSVDPAEFDQLDESDRAEIAYRAAYALGLHPNNAVAKQLGITPAAAAKRVERLRQAGRLEATSPGRKGV